MLTDAQILYCFTHLSDSNGRKCCRVLYNELDWRDRKVCEGHVRVKDGKLTLHDTCGEPCSFRKDATKFAHAAETLLQYDQIIEEAKRRRATGQQAADTSAQREQS